MDFIKNDTHADYITTLGHFLPVAQFCGKKFGDDSDTLLFRYRVGITHDCHFIYLFFCW
ncbi:MAG: hypothetical protein WAT53_08430 [Nitrosomonas sp.]